MLSLRVVLGTVVILISHRPTPETMQLVPDELVRSHPFSDSASLPTDPSTVSFPLRAERSVGLVPHAYLSTYTRLPTPGNTYVPHFSLSTASIG